MAAKPKKTLTDADIPADMATPADADTAAGTDTDTAAEASEPAAPPKPERLTKHQLRQRAAEAMARVDVEKELDAILSPTGPLAAAADAGRSESGAVLPNDPLRALAIRRALEAEGWTVTPAGTVQF